MNLMEHFTSSFAQKCCNTAPPSAHEINCNRISYKQVVAVHVQACYGNDRNNSMVAALRLLLQFNAAAKKTQLVHQLTVGDAYSKYRRATSDGHECVLTWSGRSPREAMPFKIPVVVLVSEYVAHIRSNASQLLHNDAHANTLG